MLYYLPHFYPPASPTHQLVYVPPAPSTYTRSSASLSTPPQSPVSSTTSRNQSRHHAPLPRRSHHPTTTISAPATARPLIRQQLAPRLPPTPTSSTFNTASLHPELRRPPVSTHPSAPQQPVINTPPRAVLFEPSPMSTPTAIPANIISTADLLSRTKIRSCHLATDHDCILRKYEMTMRQQPVQARMCGVGEKCKSLSVVVCLLPTQGCVVEVHGPALVGKLILI
jgi:hypothetical protein